MAHGLTNAERDSKKSSIPIRQYVIRDLIDMSRKVERDENEIHENTKKPMVNIPNPIANRCSYKLIDSDPLQPSFPMHKQSSM